MPVTVIVDHLPLHATEDLVAELFRRFGPVRSVRIVRAGRTQSLAFGFVELDNPEQACSAVLSLNGELVGGQKITVALAEDPNPEPFQQAS
jgi:RNA recognition motif-containing protein